MDEAFIGRALDDADLNALRLALYQATGDETLLELPLKTTPMYGGALKQTVLAEESVETLRAKATEFLLGTSGAGGRGFRGAGAPRPPEGGGGVKTKERATTNG
ncbi:hypothetical protein, partial [Streptomyces sp. NPDC058457]|uniref:hypothetical protein n=1 Tax=Streptomyces sp. NPDC058457 TaxID=3346507 RepID=UPI00364FDC08